MKSEFLPAFLIGYSDSDFTNPHEAMLPDEPRDCRGDFTHMGAKYWGFESRRHRATTVLADKQALLYDHGAHDWLLIGLKRRAEVSVIRISTKWYTGNQVRSVSVFLKDDVTGKKKRVLSRQPLKPDSEHEFGIAVCGDRMPCRMLLRRRHFPHQSVREGG
jgi:allantoicase